MALDPEPKTRQLGPIEVRWQRSETGQTRYDFDADWLTTTFSHWSNVEVTVVIAGRWRASLNLGRRTKEWS